MFRLSEYLFRKAWCFYHRRPHAVKKLARQAAPGCIVFLRPIRNRGLIIRTPYALLRHFRGSRARPHPTYDGHSEGYTHAALVDHATGSLHTGLSIDELAPGGTIAPHVHAYEESFYLLSGQAVLGIGEQTYLLGPGDLRAL